MKDLNKREFQRKQIMGNYISKAFVIVSDTKLQKELTDKLNKMFPNDEENHLEDASCFVADKGSIYKSYFCPVIDFIECNDYTNGDEDLAVKLFLALAEMQRFKDTNQWFKRITVDGIEYVKHSQKLICKIGVRAFDRDCFPLTPLELAEAVMRGDVKL